MCDLCSILKEKTLDQKQEQNVLHTRTIASVYRDHIVQIKLCGEHERLFFLKGERGFLRLFTPLEEAVKKGTFAKRAKPD